MSADDLIPRFEKALERMLLNHSSRDNSGAFVSSEGFPSGTHGSNALFIAIGSHCYFDPLSQYRGKPSLLEIIESALDFQFRLVKDSGLIDLESTNWQSPPDTAFTVQLLAPIVELTHLYNDLPGAESIRQRLLAYITRSSKGINHGGFHTPNHRWVICSALAYAQSLNSQLDYSEYIGQILNEGIDINDDGEYSERSTGIYTAVTNRSLIIMAEKLSKPELLQPVRKSLDFVTTFFQPDGTVVTSMSSRQDKGKAVVPQELADIFAIMGHLDGNVEWAQYAEMIAERTKFENPSPWLIFPFIRFPELRQTKASRLANGINLEAQPSLRKLLPDSGLYRIRDGEMALTLSRNDHDLLDLVWGPIHLRSLRIAGTYFGIFRFEAKTLANIPGGIRATLPPSELQQVGYYQPLNRPVPFSEIHEAKALRPVNSLPQFGLQLDLTSEKDYIQLDLSSTGGIPGVLGQIELCFDVPQMWHTDNALIYLDPESGGNVILQDGYGTLRIGQYALRIGPGTSAHRTHQMRGALVSTGWRVTIPLITPFEHTVTLQPGYWFEPENTFVPRSQKTRP